ncbi:MAG: IspD/TarI family cytidylyltransferase [Phycisphaeraceae bacterium]
MSIAVILPAAGAGTRFNDSGPASEPVRSKVETELAGKAVFLRAVELFFSHEDVSQVLLAVHPERVDEFKQRWGDRLGLLGVEVVAGGTAERWETVAKAIKHVRDECTHIAVHDAARPMASDAMITRVFETAKRYHAAIPAVAVTGTLKRVEPMEAEATATGMADEARIDDILGGAGKPSAGPVQRVVETVPREALVEVQTPQVFDRDLLERAYAQITAGGLDATGITDDASLVERLGEPVAVVEGDPLNLKITHAQDMELAEAVLTAREAKQAAELGKKQLFGDIDEEE